MYTFGLDLSRAKTCAVFERIVTAFVHSGRTIALHNRRENMPTCQTVLAAIQTYML